MNAIRFVTKNLLKIDTQARKSVDWSNQYLIVPIPKPVEVKVGDAISIGLNYREGCSLSELSENLQIEVIDSIDSLKNAM